MPRLELDGVRVAAAAGEASLADFAFAFDTAAWYVLLGPRGSGGPAVLDAISGRRALTAGAVRLDAARIDTLAPAARRVARVGASLLPYPAMRVGAALESPLRGRGGDRGQVRKRARWFADALELGPHLRQRCDRVPDVVRTRLDLARALIRPDLAVLLVDALGAGTDRFEQARLRELVRDAVRERGVIVVQATSDQREALAVADKVLALEAGRLVQVGAPAELLGRPGTAALAAALGDPGMNLLPCALRGRWVVVLGARFVHPPAERVAPSDGEGIVLGVRPEDVSIGVADAEGVMAAELIRVEDRGYRRLAVFTAGEHELQADAAPGDDLVVGHRYGLAFAPEGIRLYRAGVLTDG